MAVITMPSSMRFDQCSFAQVRYDTMETSDATGSEAARIGGLPRWAMSLSSGEFLSPTESSAWKVMLLQLRGRINTLAAWNPMQLTPEGTMRGTMTMSSTALAGATAIVVTAGSGQAALTLLAGDTLQLGSGLGASQVVMVMADAVANGSGVIALTVEPPLRMDFAVGVAVAWNKPTVYFKLLTESIRWKYTRALGRKDGGFGIDVLESFA